MYIFMLSKAVTRLGASSAPPNEKYTFPLGKDWSKND